MPHCGSSPPSSAACFLSQLADSLAHRLAGIFQLIVVSLFLSFAIEPAVGWLARRGWRRGLATGLIFLGVAAVGAGLLALLIPAIVTGSRQLISSLPDLLNNLAKYGKPLGIRLDRASLEKQLTTYSDDLISAAQHVTGGILHIAATLAGALFQVSVVAFFTFYMVAQGPTVAPCGAVQVPAAPPAADPGGMGGGDPADRRILLLPAADRRDQWLADVPGAVDPARPVRRAAGRVRGHGGHVHSGRRHLHRRGGAGGGGAPGQPAGRDHRLGLDHHLPANRELPAGARG